MLILVATVVSMITGTKINVMILKEEMLVEENPNCLVKGINCPEWDSFAFHFAYALKVKE